MDDAIDWLQLYGDVNDDGRLAFGEAAVKAKDAAWQSGGEEIHLALDSYNNTGAINGIQVRRRSGRLHHLIRLLMATRRPRPPRRAFR